MSYRGEAGGGLVLAGGGAEVFLCMVPFGRKGTGFGSVEKTRGER